MGARHSCGKEPLSAVGSSERYRARRVHRLLSRAVLPLALLLSVAGATRAAEFVPVPVGQTSTAFVNPSGGGPPAPPEFCGTGTVSNVYFSGPNKEDFAVEIRTNGMIEFCLVLSFTPSFVGQESATIHWTALTGQHAADLIGTGTPPPPGLTPAQKDALHLAGTRLSAAGALMGQLAVVHPASSAASNLLSSLMTTAGADLSARAAADPVDANFREIAAPTPAPITPIGAGPGICPSVAADANGLLTSLALEDALADALFTSIDRAQGAFAAGDSFWQAKQMEAAQGYYAKLIAVLGQLDVQTQTFAHSVAVCDIPNSSLLTIVGAGGQQTIKAGQCVALQLWMRRTGTAAYEDVTQSPNTTFFTDPVRGQFSPKNVWSPSQADVNKSITLYGRYRDPVSGVSTTSTVHVTVRPN